MLPFTDFVFIVFVNNNALILSKHILSFLDFISDIITIINYGGTLLSYLMISYYGQIGIDLSIVSEGLDAFGMKSMVYTSLPLNYYIMITILTLFVTLISSLFPARRALKLDPAEAIKSL